MYAFEIFTAFPTRPGGRARRAAIGLAALPLLWSLPLSAQQGQAQPTTRGAEHALEVSVSDDSLEALYLRDVDIEDVGATTISGGVFFNEARDLVAIVSALSQVGEYDDTQRFSVRIGPRVYGAWLNVEDEDVLGVGLGGEVRYYLGAERNMSVSLAAFYAPDIITFGEADNITEASFRFETRLQNGTTLFLGYRAFEIDLAVDRELDDNLHVGFRREF
jgi:hypothetical protein